MPSAGLRFVFTVALFAGSAFSADDRPRLRPLGPESRNAKSGLLVGAHIPPFDLIDSTGQHQILDTLRGPKGLVLLFARSADWSPVCQAQIADFDRHVAEFRKKGLGVAVITYDPVAALQTFSQKQNLSIPLLSDAGSQTIRAFGLLNTNIAPSAAGWATPFPGVFILDEHGIVTAKYFDDDMDERFTAASILAHEFQMEGVAKTIIDTPQVTVTYSISDYPVTPGTRVSLIIDLDPKPRMHIFAPGAQGLIPLEWQMGSSKSWISFPLTYPVSRSIHLPAINETVPSYDKHVRIVRDIAIGKESELTPAMAPNRVLPVDGALRLAGCDDKDNFPPRLLFLHWNLAIAP